MKKLLGILVLGLLWCSVGFAEFVNKKILGGEIRPTIFLECANSIDQIKLGFNSIYGEDNFTLHYWSEVKKEFLSADAIVQVSEKDSKWVHPLDLGDSFGIYVRFLKKNLNKLTKLNEKFTLHSFQYKLYPENIRQSYPSEDLSFLDEDYKENIRLNDVLNDLVNYSEEDDSYKMFRLNKNVTNEKPNGELYTDPNKYLEKLKEYNSELGVFSWRIKFLVEQNIPKLFEVSEMPRRVCTYKRAPRKIILTQ